MQNNSRGVQPRAGGISSRERIQSANFEQKRSHVPNAMSLTVQVQNSGFGSFGGGDFGAPASSGLLPQHYVPAHVQANSNLYGAMKQQRGTIIRHSNGSQLSGSGANITGTSNNNSSSNNPHTISGGLQKMRLSPKNNQPL